MNSNIAVSEDLMAWWCDDVIPVILNAAGMKRYARRENERRINPRASHPPPPHVGNRSKRVL